MKLKLYVLVFSLLLLSKMISADIIMMQGARQISDKGGIDIINGSVFAALTLAFSWAGNGGADGFGFGNQGGNRVTMMGIMAVMRQCFVISPW